MDVFRDVHLLPSGAPGFVPAFVEDSTAPFLADQNNTSLLRATTLYEELRDGQEPYLQALHDRYPKDNRLCGSRLNDGLSVQSFNHYARGSSCWLTMTNTQSATIPLEGAPPLDIIPADNVTDYLGKTLYDSKTGRRNSQPFPAFLAVYFGGLDHDAHEEGHGFEQSRYRGYLANTLDPQIAKVVTALRSSDEFYNKIFLVTADHGHSRISENPNESYPCHLELGLPTNWLKAMGDTELRAQETDENNKLHIWELAKIIAGGNEVLKAFRPTLLVPRDLGGVDVLNPPGRENVTKDLDKATMVATLNGTMAHIYLRDEDTVPANGPLWASPPSEEQIGIVAEVLRLFLMRGQRIDQVDQVSGKRAFRDATHPAFYDDAWKTMRSKVDLPRLTDGPDWAVSPDEPAVDLILIRRSPEADYEVYVGLLPPTAESYVRIESIDLETYFGGSLAGNNYVQAVKRLQEMNHPQRSGDIVLLMRDHTDDAPAKRFGTGAACRGVHGGLSRADSYVPLIVSYPGGNAPSVSALVDDVCTNGQLDCTENRVLPAIVSEIIKKEYFQ